ncbi:hypothetical protein ACJQWK_10650 [Exserohilum turcicum]|uniref:Peroxisomal d3,d2-enoyl-CoA isomerase n=1 Tax=Exserohilum turcicum (strain 28A) TaxID=671987 RepID=R0I733_EXST2|nr:uncharacterized protein SETTUDRAFT_174057 [Exserohilum turcica Et28A]EOA81286.1 hypothetical protein SETTUDRAFT_174057 [Exserohilum turcica Et28A]
MTSSADYTDIKFEIRGQIGIITLNRPKVLNTFGGNLLADVVKALRVLDAHPDTVFTVLTGAGRFFSAGADITMFGDKVEYADETAKRIATMNRFSLSRELMQQMIDHKKVFVLALNGPGVGGGSAWFPGVADIILASSTAWLQCPFSSLALVPEQGSTTMLAQSMGVHRANDFLMFGRKFSAKELVDAGLYNYVWDATGDEFQKKVIEFLEGQLEVNDGKAMMEVKRLQNAPLRSSRMMAVTDALSALADRIVDGAPVKRFDMKRKELEAKRKARSNL